MPAYSEKQKHYMQMVEAVKAGHKLKGVRNLGKIKKTAAGMSRKSAHEFAASPVKKKGFR